MTRALARQLAREDEAARLRAEDDARIAAWKAIDHPACAECVRPASEQHADGCLRFE